MMKIARWYVGRMLGFLEKRLILMSNAKFGSKTLKLHCKQMGCLRYGMIRVKVLMQICLWLKKCSSRLICKGF